MITRYTEPRAGPDTACVRLRCDGSVAGGLGMAAPMGVCHSGGHQGGGMQMAHGEPRLVVCVSVRKWLMDEW